MKKKYNIGVVGWWYNLNYGGTLTYYSLNKALESLGYSVLMIKRSGNINIENDSVPYRFAKQHYNISEQYNYEELEKLNDICEQFIVGSDQLWNPQLMKYSGREFFLSFAKTDVKKNAYSTSLGNITKYDNDFVSKYGAYLCRFDNISVREDYAVDILKNDFQIEAKKVCDPIFLNGVSVFEDLAYQSRLKCDGEYVLNFILDPDSDKINACRFIRDQLNIRSYKNFTNLQDSENKRKAFDGEKVNVNADIEDFLNAYKNASFVVTDSFHGTCLALLFNKPFISFANLKRGEKRFISLLNDFGLTDRLLIKIDDIYKSNILNEKIDFDKVNTTIYEMANEGLEWLKKATEHKKHMSKAINVDEINCTGCSACSNLCPTDAISMQRNDKGFWKPSVNYDICIDCGLCKKRCIALNPNYSNSSEPECYSLIADDRIRKISSSGGAFSLFADSILDEEGYVCGAAYTSEFDVEHIIINNKDDLYKLRGSKYMQSNVAAVQPKIKRLLEDGKKVLFSGMPCQVAGLYAYLGKKYDNLYTIDLLCHGITSYKVFKKYQTDVLDGKKMQKLEFKAKEPWGWHAGVNAYFIDGSKYSEPLERDPFFKSYLRSISKNDACGNCPSNKLPRPGDITIGDFWGIHKCDSEMFDNKGTSLVLLNNERARKLFKIIEPNAKVKKEKLSDAISGNLPIKSCFKLHKNHELFFRYLNSMDFSQLTDSCIKKNTSAFQREIVSDIDENNIDLYYLAYITSKYSHGRKIVTWANNGIFNYILKKYFCLNVHCSVAKNPNIIDNVNTFDLSILNNSNDKYYIVALHPLYSLDKYLFFESLGYRNIEDFVFRYPKPTVIENYDCKNGIYLDEYGNSIEGESGVIRKVIFRGCNNHIVLGKNVKGTEKLSFDVTSNSQITIGENVRFSNDSKFEFKGTSGQASVYIGENCRFTDVFFRLYNHIQHTSIEIGDDSTFETHVEFHANAGKKIIIGKDCMFSHNIELWAGDGHSIFDVRSGKNVDQTNGKDTLNIGNHVWIGKNAFLLHGTDIKDGSIVGACSVVKGKYPNNCVIAGNPAKKVKNDVAWSRAQATNDIHSCNDSYVNITAE